MYSRRKREDEAVVYTNLDALLTAVINNPGDMFLRKEGCDALVFVPELNLILSLEAKDFCGSPEGCEHELQRQLDEIMDELGRGQVEDDVA